MNNGKLRIYDLSKDLNLENKDILSICEQLNIAVKSHSSTITEAEAEQIRTAAEKYTVAVAHQNKPKGSHQERQDKGEKKAAVVTGKPNQPQKQQIVEIHHHPQEAEKPQANNQQLLAKPQPLGSSNAREENPTQPELSTNEHQPTDEIVKPVIPPVKSEQPDQAERPQRSERPEKSAPPSGVNNVVKPKPLQKNTTETPAREGERGNVERPVPKKAKGEQGQKEGRKDREGRPSFIKKTGGVGTETAPSDVQRPQKKDSKDRNTATPALILREPPRKPSLPRKGVSLPGSGMDDDIEYLSAEDLDARPKKPRLDDDDITPDPSALELRKPNPPRQPKTKKTWVEEEEEGDVSSKTAKVGKVKRKPAVVDDDDDDFASDLEDLPETMVVSLSIARPPKPKRAPQAITAGTSAPKTKKPGLKTDNEAKDKRKEQQKTPDKPEEIVLTGSLSVRELATALMLPETEIIKRLFFRGIAVSITQSLDIDTAKLVAEELGVTVITEAEKSTAIKETEMLDIGDMEYLHRRPPVVTIMGHVDHGKTSLLDAIRQSKVAQGEAGGITQHIGAYHVDLEHNGLPQQIVFLDTPGHEAFTAMRARGARVTDIAILVVAADDGVQPQTVEAISHAKAAGVPIVVAINKIDKVGAQPDRVKQELTEYGLLAEEWGGDTIMVEVSAIQKHNLDNLLEMILLVAEVEELRANPNRTAKGTVIEAHLDKSKGPVATFLVQNGTLKVGDTLVAGSVFTKVRAMVDDRGNRVETAGPSFPVEVLGLSDVPAAGDEFEVFESEKEARSVASDRMDEQRQSRLQQLMASRRISLNTLSQQAKEGQLKELNLLLKADVQGSVEAILGSLQQLPQNEVQVRVLLAAPGEVTQTDVDLAAASGAVIIGFNTTLASGARQAADEASVDIREYNIIYNLLDDIQAAMEGLLEPELVEEPLGQIEVRAVFSVGRGAVAGCYIQSGKAIRNCRVRVKRGGKVIYEGILDSLKRMREDTKEVNAGFECGVGIDKFNAWEMGDIIETYQMVTKRRTLSPV
jgi:translation initiation factor IF-2